MTPVRIPQRIEHDTGTYNNVCNMTKVRIITQLIEHDTGTYNAMNGA